VAAWFQVKPDEQSIDTIKAAPGPLKVVPLPEQLVAEPESRLPKSSFGAPQNNRILRHVSQKRQ
jgi:hypothetical protein